MLLLLLQRRIRSCRWWSDGSQQWLGLFRCSRDRFSSKSTLLLWISFRDQFLSWLTHVLHRLQATLLNREGKDPRIMKRCNWDGLWALSNGELLDWFLLRKTIKTASSVINTSQVFRWWWLRRFLSWLVTNPKDTVLVKCNRESCGWNVTVSTYA